MWKLTNFWTANGSKTKSKRKLENVLIQMKTKPKHIGCSKSTEEQSWQTHTSKKIPGTSLLVQWLKPLISKAGDMGSIPGQGMNTPHTMWGNQKRVCVFFFKIQFPKNLNKNFLKYQKTTYTSKNKKELRLKLGEERK